MAGIRLDFPFSSVTMEKVQAVMVYSTDGEFAQPYLVAEDGSLEPKDEIVLTARGAHPNYDLLLELRQSQR